MSATTGNHENPKLEKIWLTRPPVPAASGVALSLGWLAEEFGKDGIQVGWEREQRLRIIRDPAEADLQKRTMFREGGNIIALAERAAGADTRVIGLTWIDEKQSIMVRPDQQILEPRDLKGLRFALPAFSENRNHSIARGMSLHGIKSALGLGGLGLHDVTLVDIPAPIVDFSQPHMLRRMWSGLELLAEGKVDAVYIKGAPAAEAAQALGLKEAIDLDVYPSRMSRINNGTPRPILVHQYMIDHHFDLVVRFLCQLLRAADWATTHLDELKQILVTETFSGLAGVNIAYRNGFHRGLFPDMSDERINMMKIQEQFLRAHGFLERAVDVDAWIDARPLAAATALRNASKAA